MRPAINTSIRLRLIASVLAISPMKKGCKFMRRLFFVVAFLISFPACAAMNGFLTNGLCFPDTASALESFASNYPKIENGFQYAIYSTLTTVTNYQYSMRVDNLAAGTNYSFTKAPFFNGLRYNFKRFPGDRCARHSRSVHVGLCGNRAVLFLGICHRCCGQCD